MSCGAYDSLRPPPCRNPRPSPHSFPSWAGPGQPHLFGCTMYQRPGSWDWDEAGQSDPPESVPESVPEASYVAGIAGYYDLSQLSQEQIQTIAYAKAYAAEHMKVYAVKSNELSDEFCTCDHRFTATAHAAFCPLGEKADGEADEETDTVPILAAWLDSVDLNGDMNGDLMAGEDG
jgi:hypothetical protein